MRIVIEHPERVSELRVRALEGGELEVELGMGEQAPEPDIEIFPEPNGGIRVVTLRSPPASPSAPPA